jgi:cysteine desulfurase
VVVDFLAIKIGDIVITNKAPCAGGELKKVLILYQIFTEITPRVMISLRMTFLSQFFTRKQPPRIYLDHAAATPLLPEVWQVMEPLFKNEFGNPSAVHREGVRGKQLIEKARGDMAKVLEIPVEGVVFTSGGTESNNLAIVGWVESLHRQGRPYTEMEVISTAIEHPATRNTLLMLAKRGLVVHEVAVDAIGRVDQQIVKKLLNEKTVLVTVAYVNSEIGTIEAVGALGRIVAAGRAAGNKDLLFHVDGAQAPLWLPCVMPHLRIDMLSLDAGKCGGPKSMGVLAYRKGITLAPILSGGPQERGLRPGTESAALIVGGVTAIVRAQSQWRQRAIRTQTIRDAALGAIAGALPTAIVNGATGNDRVANNINISLPGIDSEFAVVVLDENGVAASTKSACSSAGGGGSAVVKAISGDDARAASTIRLTLGEHTTLDDITAAIDVLKTHIHRQRLY